ncbi:MAG TPA: FAD-dependent oxidoreductase [Thermomicrobiales bacterium]|nr:FAD-dependent oxidoreductase [Thermomicrobiales bacterium]
MAQDARRIRVLILGGGHAGVHAARHLLKARRSGDRLDVTLVDYQNAEVFHGLMPQMVSGAVQPQHALLPLRQLLPGATIYTYEVERIDLPNRRVLLGRGDERSQLTLEYDYLVLALGSVTDVSRFPGLLEHGLQTKTVGDIFHLRNHLLDVLERASIEQDPEERRRLLTFVVAGTGFAGVEIGAQANALVRGALRYFPGIAAGEIRFVLLGTASRLLPALNEGLARRAARHLERCGVELRLNTGLASATAATATLTTGEQIPTRTLIVTVGIGTHPLVAGLPVELTRGRIACDQFCRVLDWPRVYAIGDNAAIPDLKTGQPYPATALLAFAEGEQAAANILAEIRGRRLRPCRAEDVAAALLTKGYALAEIKGIQLEGLPAALIWRLVFLALIKPWDRRLALTAGWLIDALAPRDIAQLRVSRSDTIVPMRFAAGEVIVHQGEPGSRFYIVTEGEVEVVRETPDGETPLARLGPGQYFGEIALLRDTERTATVRAAVDTRVLSIARQDFSTLVQHFGVLRDSLSAGAASQPPAIRPREGAAVHDE